MPAIAFPALHPLFETLGYAGGFAVYRRSRAREGDALPDHRRWIVIAAAALGALLGSRVLGLLEQAPRADFRAAWHWHALVEPGGGKTIVGGLLGGWLAVELAKLATGIRSRTGDLFALPLCLGIAIGRIGCFLAGLADDTYGKPTTLPWGVNFGDGIPRHPTQLYEILFLLALAATLRRARRRPHREGALFRIFMAAYLAWRLLIDFLKPQPLVHGLNLIQWAASPVWPSRRSGSSMTHGGRCMFEQPPPTSSTRPLKVLALGAVGLLLAAGFCGLDAHLYPHSNFGGSLLAVIGAGLGFVCLLLCVGAVLALIGQAIANFLRR